MPRKKSNLSRTTDRKRKKVEESNRIAELRDAETPEQKRGRLDKESKRAAEVRTAEKPQQRNTRLATMRQNSEEIRATETPEQREGRLAAVRQNSEQARTAETPEQREARLAAKRQNSEQARTSETPEQREARLAAKRQNSEQARTSETPEQREARLAAKRQNSQKATTALTPDQKLAKLAERRQSDAKRRAARPNKYRGRNAEAIMKGSYPVEYNSIGPLFREDGTPVCTPCEHCHAVKWKNEAPGMCCSYTKSDGPVSLPQFGFPPKQFQDLWEDETDEAKTFRKYARYLNNAMAMACLQVYEPPMPDRGWKPSVSIQGKVTMLMGPLQTENPEEKKPVFSQLYVLDPELAQDEAKLRFNNMSVYLPKTLCQWERPVLQDLVTKLQTKLTECNAYVRDFKTAGEILQEERSPSVRICIDANKRPDDAHARIYNKGFKEISVLIDDEKPGPRQFELKWRAKGNQVKELFDSNRASDPLHFPLLFPTTGQDGWHLGINRKNDTLHQGSKGAIPPMQFYAYHFQIRYHPAGPYYSDALFRARKLFHEYACIAYAKVENQRLRFFKLPETQKKLRGDKYNRLFEDVHDHPPEQEGTEPVKHGSQIILPPSHVGSPRYMHEHFQDAIAVVREYHKPDVFITYTCNPEWPEIRDSVLPGQTAQDRPDIVARVFKLKLRNFIIELARECVMGKVVARMHVTEFQKRGLPHAHILLIFDADDRLQNADDVNKIISAELPEPDQFPKGSPEYAQAKRLYDLVLQCMIHTCSASCLGDDGLCTKGYPKTFCEETKWDEREYYPVYRRRKRPPVVYKDKLIDNRNVVPYSPYFLLRDQAHINFEACVSPTAAKYLCKYITKGPDRSMMTLDIDEVENYLNLRSIGASEAFWRIFGFPITDRFPPVTALRIHLENEQFVVFTEDDAKDVAEQGPLGKDASHILDTELNAFFAYNTAHQQCTDPNCIPLHNQKYIDFPKYFTYNQPQKCWKPRKTGVMIGRLHTIHPKSGDEFYLRMLLHHNHCRGATSFKHLRSYKAELCDSFQAVCQQLGLLEDDKEWHQLLVEAYQSKYCSQIRNLFATILLFCTVAEPRRLFDEHWLEWCDDIRLKYPTASDEQLKALILLDIEHRIKDSGKSLFNYKLPAVNDETKQQLEELTKQPQVSKVAVIVQEEQNFDLEQTTNERDSQIASLTPSQQAVFHEVFTAVIDRWPSIIFLSVRGGTGKTFVLNTLLAAARTINGEKNIALAVASSGIAATLLKLGRTFHSRFKVPIKKSEHMTFSIKPSDSLGQVIRECRLIVWDEAPMMHRFMLEGLDRALQDITNTQLPFGGKVIVMAGDFRQVLPVIERGSRAMIVDASLQKSQLWQHVRIRELTENMRIGNDPSMASFDQWLLELGNGQLPIAEHPDKIAIPEDHVVEIDDKSPETIRHSRKTLIECIFPNLTEQIKLMQQGNQKEWLSWLSERAILAPTNKEVDAFNEMICEMFPGELLVFYSADRTMDENDMIRYPTDYLNSLTPAGLPPHQLLLKAGMVIMLMRNLNPRQGLCNGTRLILQKASERMLQCTIAGGDRSGEIALIPRIDLNTTDEKSPIQWKRRQFPVRPSFAMTINKSQGQTVQNVGVWLLDPVFTHGQLYVAASRVTKPSNLHFALKTSAEGKTRNVVYTEALL